MKLIGSITLMIVLIIPLHAQAQIEGGFGLKLGDVLDVDSDELEAVKGSDNAVYRVKPPKPLPGFDVYQVYVTPLTHKIYQIRAFRHFKIVHGAKNEYTMLRKLLENKYGKEEDNGYQRLRSPGMQDQGKGITIRRGSGSVSLAYYSGRDVAEVNKVTDQYVFPRVVITYRNKDFELRNEEYRAIYRNRQELEEASRKKRLEEADSIL